MKGGERKTEEERMERRGGEEKEREEEEKGMRKTLIRYWARSGWLLVSTHSTAYTCLYWFGYFLVSENLAVCR